MNSLTKILFLFLTIHWTGFVQAQATSKLNSSAEREHLLMDFGWRFNFGNASDFAKDYYNGTSYFTYFAKAGYGDGAASKNFEDRAWRQLDLPHDWAAELPFSGNASHSHGYKTIGWKYPETSVGWYRKTFSIPQSDLGRKISIQFDGVFRNSIVWVNGFYLGQEQSGYAGFEYDITDYINYGGDNVVAVRVDASIEEGWFYEGAGIYRHTWLNKTNPLHVSSNGTFVTSEIDADNAELTIRSTIENQNKMTAPFTIAQMLFDAAGRQVATIVSPNLQLKAVSSNTFYSKLKVEKPRLWSIEEPYLYKLVTRVISNGNIKDSYETNVGIRTLKFDAEKGFFLNGKHIKIKGTNNHQDHAGVGTAIPDALQEFRIKRLKEMGCNAIRTSHNPATPELLNVCDRLGMLVLEENRLMGINQEHFDLLKRMIVRDRNHPCVIIWSLGNEEWAVESNILGERITSTLQAYAQTLDSSRRFTVAISGGCGNGSSRSIDVMGFNYLTQCDIDEYHKKFPDQPSLGTEETTTSGTRGVYEDDKNNGHMAATDRSPEGPSIERGWKFYDERPFLSGLFFWTGFDYKGEPNPLAWPAVSSQFGIIDACGFPKDEFYYLKSWWTNEPVLHIAPHWNWKGKEGKEISVWVYSNCDDVELFLNKKSLGRKTTLKNSHLEWNVKYEPGTLLAHGYKNGKEIMTDKVETTSDPVKIQLTATKTIINADGEDLSVLTVKVCDEKGRSVPIANNEITFAISGPGKIIGIGNGDPGSHEPDKFFEVVEQQKIENLKMKKVENKADIPELSDNNDLNWTIPFIQQQKYKEKDMDSMKLNVIRGTFTLSRLTNQTEINLFPRNLCLIQSIYINGHLIAKDISINDPAPKYKLDHAYLLTGKNVFTVVGTPLVKKSLWDELNTDPGLIQIINPAGDWKRKLFNGLAQVIVKSTKEPGDIRLTAKGRDLIPETIMITSINAITKPTVESISK